MIRVAIVEDDPVTLVGLQEVIEQTDTLIVSVAVKTVEQFDARSHAGHDVVILDLCLRGGGLEGADAVEHLRARGFPVLVVSVSNEEVPVLDAITAGACGYLTKEAEPYEIVRAVETVAAGRTYFSPTVAGYLLKQKDTLTPRERQVLRLVAQGETSRTIAGFLKISEKTVNGCLDRIRDKTGCRRRADLTRLAIERGLLGRLASTGKENA